MAFKTLDIVPGSLASVAASNGISIAEAFTNADHMVLVDVSGSMEIRDSRGGLSRYDVACQELATLQRDLPGRLAIVAFASRPQFCPAGVPMFTDATGSGTAIAEALKFAKPVDGLMDLWIISDGQPGDGPEALAIARRMQSRISGVYVGPKGGEGADFLRELCAIRGGQAAESSAAIGLAATVQRMLAASPA